MIFRFHVYIDGKKTEHKFQYLSNAKEYIKVQRKLNKNQTFKIIEVADRK